MTSEFFDKIAIIDGRVNKEIEDFFINKNIELIKVNILGARLETACHPDIFFHPLSNKKLVCAPQVANLTDACKILASRGFQIIYGESIVNNYYNAEVSYNVARIGNFAFHNLKYTDPILKRELEIEGVELIHVNQGYTKCSISIVDDNSIITADKGIAKKAYMVGIDVLLIQPHQGIYLDGKNEGFIGGATGRLNNTWLISGELCNLKDHKIIENFVKSKNIECVNISKGKVKDIGTIFVL